MYVKAVNEEVTNLKDSKVGHTGGFERVNGKKEMLCLYYDLKICF